MAVRSNRKGVSRRVKHPTLPCINRILSFAFVDAAEECRHQVPRREKGATFDGRAPFKRT